MPYTYVVRCSDDTYYVGSTWDLELRLWQHNHTDEGAAYTRHRRPIELAWCGWFDSIAQAFAFEKRVQGWSRAKREALIRGEFEALPALSRRSAVQRRMREAAEAAESSQGGFEAPR
jgi:predicted GIY-YIG superfamily endonuclease